MGIQDQTICRTNNTTILNMKTFASISTLLAVAAANHLPASYHPAPVVHKPVAHAPAYGHPAPAYKEPTYDEPAVYKYGYAVHDDYSGAHFSHNENRDGYATYGEYQVALPDGRTQIVTYNVADAYSGYVADVKYEGEAHYEPHNPAPAKDYHPAPVVHKPAPYHPAPVVHKPAPVYHPAPAVHKPAPASQPAPTYQPAPAYQPAPTYHV